MSSGLNCLWIWKTHANALNLCSSRFFDHVISFIFDSLSFMNASSTAFQLYNPSLVQRAGNHWELRLREAYWVKMANFLSQTAYKMQAKRSDFSSPPHHESSFSNMISICFKLLLKHVWIINKLLLCCECCDYNLARVFCTVDINNIYLYQMITDIIWVEIWFPIFWKFDSRF